MFKLTATETPSSTSSGIRLNSYGWREHWLTSRQNQSNDGRIASGQDNSSGGTLSHFGENSSSLSSLGWTFLPVLIYAAICFAIFFTFRRKYPRVYAPRTLPSLRKPE
jgi:hypothetical protein